MTSVRPQRRSSRWRRISFESAPEGAPQSYLGLVPPSHSPASVLRRCSCPRPRTFARGPGHASHCRASPGEFGPAARPVRPRRPCRARAVPELPERASASGQRRLRPARPRHARPARFPRSAVGSGSGCARSCLDALPTRSARRPIHASQEPIAADAAVARPLADPGAHPLSEEMILDDAAPSGVVRIDPPACSLCGACARLPDRGDRDGEGRRRVGRRRCPLPWLRSLRHRVPGERRARGERCRSAPTLPGPFRAGASG